MAHQQKQTNVLLKFLLPMFLTVIPIGTLVLLYAFYEGQEEPITWYEVILVPLNVFFVTLSVAAFFALIWYYRHYIGRRPVHTKD